MLSWNPQWFDIAQYGTFRWKYQTKKILLLILNLLYVFFLNVHKSNPHISDETCIRRFDNQCQKSHRRYVNVFNFLKGIQYWGEPSKLCRKIQTVCTSSTLTCIRYNAHFFSNWLVYNLKIVSPVICKSSC